MKKILFVFGTRPEAIKLAPVILEVKKHQKIVLTKVLITAQHREMMDEVLEVFKIKPDFDLNIMLPNQTLSEVTSRILTGVEDILKRERPNLVFVQGDTTTVLATALACYYQRITLVHVEAGLRSFDKFQPFPEEINRRLVSHIADFNFAPTEEAAENLLNEGIERKKILVTGNTVIDALFMAIKKKGSFSEELDKVDFNKRLILLTAHRRENFGLPLENICQAVKEISKLGEDLEIVYPVHLNPNVQETVRKILRNIPNVKLLKPLDYLSFCHLMKKSYLILTDSGGIQEEASSLNKPILVLRNVTERPEVIKTGAAILVGTDQKKIVRETKSLLEDEQKYRRMGTVSNPFGDGKA
ncbi:MAG: UDP-N-acetylglucosamine 2-epimerase (non-hydrolyzing), partial [Parcubacteria group bacterium]|nr:UDP-N-acetylglucosamine 2-epimerase (non-hydrolyzing) [Parcubacteria group bacterium]